jgi:DNA-binding MarR family transcriptional regulator
MQEKLEIPLSVSSIEGFRSDLRVLEREIIRQLEGETGCCGVTLSQCHVLLELSASEMSLSALAAVLDLDASTLSRTVESMVQAGFVERAVDPADRRAVRLRLAPGGREKAAAINAMCNEHYVALLGRLPEKDQRQVTRAVRVLAETMRRFRAEGTASCCGTSRKEAGRGKK